MSFAPPPPAVAATKPPFFAWFLPLAGVLALVGGILPWFQPTATIDGSAAIGDVRHSWEDGRIGIIPPVLMLIAGVSAILVLLGRSGVSRFSGNSVKDVGIRATVIGVVSLVLLAIAYVLVGTQYKTDDGRSLKDLPDNDRGTQLGFYLVVAAAVIFVVIGALVFLQTRKVVAPPAFGTPGFGTPAFGAPGAGMPPAPPVAQGYQQAPPQGYQQAPFAPEQNWSQPPAPEQNWSQPPAPAQNWAQPAHAAPEAPESAPPAQEPSPDETMLHIPRPDFANPAAEPAPSTPQWGAARPVEEYNAASEGPDLTK